MDHPIPAAAARAALALVGAPMLVALVAAPAARGPAAVEVTRLQAQATDRPLGIDDPRPRLRWALASAARGVRQAAFQVRVASAPELVRRGRADLWDSGRVAAAEPGVVYAGKPLVSRTRYYWSVRVWLAGGVVSAWPEPTWMETAFLDPAEWRAAWIAGLDRPLSRPRRTASGTTRPSATPASSAGRSTG